MVCWRSRDVNFVFSRGKERYALRDSEIRDVAAKMSFSVDHGFSAFENGWVGSDGSASEAVNGCRVDCSVGGSEGSPEDMFKTRSRRTEPLERT